MKYFLSLVIILFVSTGFSKEVPVLDSPVNDYAGILSVQEKSELNTTLRSYFSSTTNQVGVLIIKSLEGDNLESYANRVFTTWKLGDAKKDNGVLFLLVTEGKMRIEVGQGLEGDLTDAESKRILAQAKPNFKQKKWADGISVVIDKIKGTIEKNQNKTAKEYPAPSVEQVQNPVPTVPFDWSNFVSILSFGVIVGTIVALIYFVIQNHDLDGSIESSNKNMLANLDQTKKLKELELDQQKETSKKRSGLTEELNKVKNQYENSDQGKAEELESKQRSLFLQIKQKESRISDLKSLAKKYGVRV